MRILLLPTPLLICMAMAPVLTHAQKLPPVSRTVFKCQVAGKTVYSDAPCLGAQQIDVEPTRGLDQLSGRRHVGADVMNEQGREALAEAVRPLTGMDAKQLAVQGRRSKLSSDALHECRRLDTDMAAVKQDEKVASGAELSDVQVKLFQMRKRFKELGC